MPALSFIFDLIVKTQNWQKKMFYEKGIWTTETAKAFEILVHPQNLVALINGEKP